MSYPKWKFRGMNERQLVNSPDEEQALGSGWGDAPGGEASAAEAEVEPAAAEKPADEGKPAKKKPE